MPNSSHTIGGKEIILYLVCLLAVLQKCSKSFAVLKLFTSAFEFVDVVAVPLGVVIESIVLVTLFKALSKAQPVNARVKVVAKVKLDNFILYPLIFNLVYLKKCLKMFDF